MIQLTDLSNRIARRIAGLAVPLLVVMGRPVAAQPSGDYAAMMGGGGSWGLFGGLMGLWGLLWMGLLFGLPLVLAYSILAGRANRRAERRYSGPRAGRSNEEQRMDSSR
ncbi:hypothetical protein [Haloarchaeobius sp. HME9146]|uniref:hypothetical protein n=1 Tax=Haloarchaeobius sp. HME9146 TaxID=2978732 RepID=UPI0021C023A7|nr:hypothetical protein [Haloarchaeobius sp. HME9146]MCT9098225.1 hypothetical protein [Haloarchaeobius sp. HME9146]